MVKFTIGILSYNESLNIPLIVERVMEVQRRMEQIVEMRILIIDNGSTDDTSAVIKVLENKYSRVSSIRIEVNQGYGYGVKTGLNNMAGDIIGFMWGDNQFDALILEKMLRVFIDSPRVQFVKTYRTKRHDGRYRLLISKIYQLLFRLLYGGKIRDINSGPKLFRSGFFSQILPLNFNDWFIDAEIMIKSVGKLKENELAEIPIEFHPRKFGKSNVKLMTCFEFLKNLIFYRFKSI